MVKKSKRRSTTWLIDACNNWNVNVSYHDISGLQTAIYSASENDNEKPNLLLIHGLNGSWRGLKQMGYLLKGQYNVFFVDLPAHGASAVPETFDMSWWSSWTKALLEDENFFHSTSGHIDRIIAHSFGCYVAALMKEHRDIPTTFLTPVFQKSKFMEIWGDIVNLATPLAIATYNIQVWASFRGFVLCHKHNLDSWRICRWLSAPPYSSHEQLRYQSKIMNNLPTYSLPYRPSDRIVIGEFDAVVKREDVGDKPVTIFSGSHMAPIEDAESLTKVIGSL